MGIGWQHGVGRAVATGALVAFAACAPTSEDAQTEQVDQTIVGGRPESRYPAAGYMAIAADDAPLAGPYCGATLIAPNLAVTAAHCIDAAERDRHATRFGLGLGAVDDRAIYPARAVVRHPDFEFDPALYAYHHDVALLVLESDVPGVEPATIAAAPEDGCHLREIGYGRVTPGDVTVLDGYTNERRSTRVCLDREDSGVLFIHGRRGGLCYGDSGGAVMLAHRNEIVGVLSAFSDSAGECAVGNHVTLTALDAERRWIARVAADHAPDAAPAEGEACGDFAAVTVWTCVGKRDKVRCDDGVIARVTCDTGCVTVGDGDDTCHGPKADEEPLVGCGGL